MEGDPTRRVISRTNRSTDRKVEPRQTISAASSRVSGSMRMNPPTAMKNPNSKKYARFIGVFLKGKLNQHRMVAFDRMREHWLRRTAVLRNISFKSHRLFSSLVANLYQVAFKKILMESIRSNSQALKQNLEVQGKLLDKGVTVLGSVLKTRQKTNLLQVISRLRIIRAISLPKQQFRLSKVNIVANLIKKRLQLHALHKIKKAAIRKKLNATAIDKLFKVVNWKSILNRKWALISIQLRANKVKQQAAATAQKLTSQQELVVEQPVEQAPPSKPADRRLVMNVERAQNQIKGIKQRSQRELNEKQRKLQELQNQLSKIREVNGTIKEDPVVQQVQANVVIPRSRVYENIFTNFLFFLKNSEESLTKDKAIESLLTPMSRIDMPVDTIRLQNQVLMEVLEQYKKLKVKPNIKHVRPPWHENKPYEYLLKQNRELYETLKQLIQNKDLIKNNKSLEQLAVDFEQLQNQLVSRSPSRI